jgi:hypothetical protein
MAASFYASPLIGATTTLACFAHEIPHEIADYSILIRSGFTKKQAMQSQFLTAVGAFVSIPSRLLATCSSHFPLAVSFFARSQICSLTRGLIATIAGRVSTSILVYDARRLGILIIPLPERSLELRYIQPPPVTMRAGTPPTLLQG